MLAVHGHAGTVLRSRPASKTDAYHHVVTFLLGDAAEGRWAGRVPGLDVFVLREDEFIRALYQFR